MGTRPERRGTPAIGWLAFLLAVSILARVGIYARVSTWLGNDSFSYLNLARQIRGVPTPSAWDELASLPRDNQAARTPGYPLLLDLTFLLAGQQPTPASLLAALEKQGRFDPWHFDFLARSENIRAVQLVQHALGIVATLLVYATVLRWTRRPWLAACTTGLAVSLRPAWLYLYEPAVHTEVLAGTLMLLLVWMMAEIEGRPDVSLGRAALIAVVSAAGVLVRPSLIFGALLVFGGLRAIGRCGGRVLTAAVALWLSLIGGWVVHNGVVHGYWSFSSVIPQNLVSHIRYDQDAFTDALVGALCAEYCGRPYAGVWILRSMVRDSGLSYVEASSRLGEQSLRAILRHPGAYLASASGAFVRFWYPQEVLLRYEGAPAGIARLSRTFWRAYEASYVLATGIAALAVFFVPVCRTARLATAMVAVSAVGISVIVAEPRDNVRDAFPFAPIMLMVTASLVGHGLDWLAGRRGAPSPPALGPEELVSPLGREVRGGRGAPEARDG